MNNAGERGSLTGASHANPQQAVAIQRAGEHLVAGLLVGGQRLPGDRALVNRGDAPFDDAVGGNAFAGARDNHVAGNERRRVDFSFAAVG
jgi:hypothetical protein